MQETRSPPIFSGCGRTATEGAGPADTPSPPRTKCLMYIVLLTFLLCKFFRLFRDFAPDRATTVFAQRRIRAAVEAMTARASRLRILVVRQSLSRTEFALSERDAQ